MNTKWYRRDSKRRKKGKHRHKERRSIGIYDRPGAWCAKRAKIRKDKQREQMMVLDEIARNYIAMGVVEDESDIRDCKRCGFSIMPWHIGCEACGSNGETGLSELLYLWIRGC